jgi:hypothetical protein
MKKLKNIIAIAAIALTAAFAQAQDKGSRVCHVGSQEIVEAMPEAKQDRKNNCVILKRPIYPFGRNG